MATSKKPNKKSAGRSSAASQQKAADERILKRARSTVAMSIFEALIVGVLGFLLIMYPDTLLKVAFYVIGILLIVKGVYKIVNYFAVRGKYDFYNNDLLYGVIALIFGILAVVLWEQLSGAIGLVAGAWIIYGALVRMNTAVKMHAVKAKTWFYVLLLSLVMLALGIYMIISLGVVFAVIGWVMIAAALISIVEDAMFMKNLDAITE